jgi:hypothetical protein
MLRTSTRSEVHLMRPLCALLLLLLGVASGLHVHHTPLAEAPLILLRRATLSISRRASLDTRLGAEAEPASAVAASEPDAAIAVPWSDACSADADQWLVALEPPITSTKRTLLSRTGAVLSGFLPASAFLVVGNLTTKLHLLSLPFVHDVIALAAAHRIAPELDAYFLGDEREWARTIPDAMSGPQPAPLRVTVVTPSVPGLRMDTISALAAAIIGRQGVVLSASSVAEGRSSKLTTGDFSALVHGKLEVELDRDAAPALVEQLSRQPWVHWLSPTTRVRTHNLFADVSIQSVGNGAAADAFIGPADDDAHMHPLWAAGLAGQGQLVGVGDSGLDVTSCFFAHMDSDGTLVPPGPHHRKVRAYRTSTGDGVDGNGHGTHTCASLAGAALNGTGDAPRWNGLAREARIVFTDLGVGSSGRLYLPSDLSSYYSFAHNLGARVHSDSWGGDSATYDVLSREVDEYSWEHRDFLPVLAGGNYGIVGNPANSKNCLSVGATLYGAAGLDVVASFSAFGPTPDGRTKPDLLAPGETRSAAPKPGGESGACYTDVSRGTSMAAPLAAAAAAIVRQWFSEGFYPAGERRPQDALQPSGALVKAVLINGAELLPGYVSTQQGHGRVHLGRHSTPLARTTPTRLFVADDAALYGGETHRFCLRLAVPARTGGNATDLDALASEPADLRVTLAWHDPPALLSAGGPKLVNDLDLRVIDIAAGAAAAPESPPNRLDNVERVLVARPSSAYLIEVHGFTVPWPDRVDGGQPYALVASGPGASGGAWSDVDACLARKL